MSNLSEFSNAVGSLAAEDLTALYSAGVTSRTLHYGASVVGTVFAALNDSAGTWQPHESGTRMFVVPCGERGPHDIGWRRIDDLAAFSISDPDKFWLRHDAVNLLNACAVDRAAYYDQPLTLHDTPLDWLRGGCGGAVVVRWSDPHISTWLLGVRRVLVDTWRSRTRLLSALSERLPQKHIPEIRVREIKRHAA